MRLFIKKLLCAVALLCVVGCEVKIPEGVIVPEKMEPLLYDYHLAQVITAGQASSSYEKKLHINYVFDKHGVTKEVFDSSLVWYTRYPRKMLNIYSSLEKKLAAELDDKDITLSQELQAVEDAETVNLWSGSRLKILSSAALCNKVTFKVQAAPSDLRGDSVSLSFTALNLLSDSALQSRATAAITVEYKDGSEAANSVNITNNGAYIVAVERNYDSDIKEVRGFVYYTDNDSLCSSKLLLSDIKLLRIHPVTEE